MASHFVCSSFALPVPQATHAACFSARDELVVQTQDAAVRRLCGPLASQLSSTPLPELASWLFSCAGDSEAVSFLLAVGQSGTVYVLDASGRLLSSVPLGRKIASSRRLMGETRALSFCGIFFASSQLSDIILFRASPPATIKLEFAGGPKKKLKITALATAPAGVSALALTAADSGLWVLRYSAQAVVSRGECPVTSFAFSKEVGGVRSLAFCRHDRDTLLLVAADADAAMASLWAWRAKATDEADGGSLFCIRKLMTHSPNSVVAFHPRLPVCMFVSGSNERCTASFLDLESGSYASKLIHFDSRGNTKLVVSRSVDDAEKKQPAAAAADLAIHTSSVTGLIATAFGSAFVEHQLLVREGWGEPVPACLHGLEALVAKMRPLALVPGEGVPLLERFIELKSGPLSTGSVSVVSVDASEDSILLKSHGAISHMPLNGSTKSALFQRASDACFLSRGRIMVVSTKQFAFAQRRAAGGQAERASSKIALQLDTRRVFSTPFLAGGELAEASSFGDCVIYVAEDPASGCDVLCFSRNIAPEYGSTDADDYFMLITRQLEISAKDLRRDAPVPRNDPMGLNRRSSAYFSVDQVDKDRDVHPDVAHVFLCEQGERIIKVTWATGARGGAWSSSDAPWLGVLTSRRLLLLSGGARLKLECQTRCDAPSDHPTSLAFVAPRALAFTTQHSWGQVMVLEGAGVVRPLASLRRPCGPVVVVGATLDSLVIRMGDTVVTRPLLPLEALACSTSGHDPTALSHHALVSKDDSTTTLSGATDSAMLRMPPALAAQLLSVADPCLLPSTRVALARQSPYLAFHLAAHHPSLLPHVALDSAPIDNAALLVSLTKHDGWALLQLLAEMLRTPERADVAKQHLRSIRRLGGPLAHAAKALLGPNESEDRPRHDSAAQLAVDAASLKAGIERRDRRASTSVRAVAAMRLPLTGESAPAVTLESLPTFPSPPAPVLQTRRPLGLNLVSVHDWLGVSTPRRVEANPGASPPGVGEAKLVISGDGEGACVGYWRFEESEAGVTTTMDLSRFGRHADISGDASIDFDSADSVPTEHGGRRPAGVLVLGGSASLRAGNVDLGGQHGCTLEAWVRFHSVEQGTLFAGRLWSMRIEQGKFGVYDNGTSVVETSRAVKTMQWMHVAVAIGSGGSHFYLDGKMLAKGPPVKAIKEAGDLVMGDGIRGELFEVRVWAVCREAWEIEAGMRSYLLLADKVRAKKPTLVNHEWTQLLDPATGQMYYFCKQTGESAWILPESAKQNKPDIVPEWTQVHDPDSGAMYFYNIKTGESKWTLDTAAESKLERARAVSSGTSSLAAPPRAAQRSTSSQASARSSQSLVTLAPPPPPTKAAMPAAHVEDDQTDSGDDNAYEDEAHDQRNSSESEADEEHEREERDRRPQYQQSHDDNGDEEEEEEEEDVLL